VTSNPERSPRIEDDYWPPDSSLFIERADAYGPKHSTLRAAQVAHTETFGLLSLIASSDGRAIQLKLANGGVLCGSVVVTCTIDAGNGRTYDYPLHDVGGVLHNLANLQEGRVDYGVGHIFLDFGSLLSVRVHYATYLLG
jgi:hypothetical protein